MNLSRMAWTRYRTKRDEPGGVRKVLRCKKIYPRLAANGARVATREAREGQKLHILPFFSKSLVVSVVPLANLVGYGGVLGYSKDTYEGFAFPSLKYVHEL